jgi:hypothetical protein
MIPDILDRHHSRQIWLSGLFTWVAEPPERRHRRPGKHHHHCRPNGIAVGLV